MPVPLSRTRRLNSLSAPMLTSTLVALPERGGHAPRLGHLLDHVHDLVAQAGGWNGPGTGPGDTNPLHRSIQYVGDGPAVTAQDR
jgi:hypothetical protein